MAYHATWRALAITYGVVAFMQLFLGLTVHATWAWVVAATCAVISGGFGVAAVRGQRILSNDRKANAPHRRRIYARAAAIGADGGLDGSSLRPLAISPKTRRQDR